jgi:uncharacterized protein YecE (DUF72 family)
MGDRRGRARVGCSGWDYKDWRGRFYPERLPHRSWFEHYATRFDTVELNATFYRLPARETVQRWADQAPPGFLYAMKLGAFGSHRMKLRDAESWLPNHLDRAQLLRSSEGPTLVQLPPRWSRDVGRLDDFLATARRLAPDTRWAVELRDPSWLHDDVFAALERHGAALCVHDLLEHHPWERTTDWTYVRFHGPHAIERPYADAYGPQRLWRHAERLNGWLSAGVDVYAYFNNDREAHAIVDATWLRDRLEQDASVPAG